MSPIPGFPASLGSRQRDWGHLGVLRSELSHDFSERGLDCLCAEWKLGQIPQRESNGVAPREENHGSIVDGERQSRDGSERTDIKRTREGGHSDIYEQEGSRGKLIYTRNTYRQRQRYRRNDWMR